MLKVNEYPLGLESSYDILVHIGVTSLRVHKSLQCGSNDRAEAVHNDVIDKSEIGNF